MKNKIKVDDTYHIVRAGVEPGYMIWRSKEIIEEQERILGESKAKSLVTKISWGWETIKISMWTGLGYLCNHYYNL